MSRRRNAGVPIRGSVPAFEGLGALVCILKTLLVIMTNQGLTSRKKTLRIARLLDTRVRLVRLELVGHEHPVLSRLSTLIVYGPLVLIGYAFLVAAIALAVATAIGWGLALVVVGAVHVGAGLWGIRRARSIRATSFDVVEPDLAMDGDASETVAAAQTAGVTQTPAPALEPSHEWAFVNKLPPPSGSRASASRVAVAAPPSDAGGLSR